MTMITYDSPIDEFEPHHFSADACEIGLRPGEWPERLETNIGNGLALMRRTKKLSADGDLMWVTYLQANGCVSLRVYND